MTMALDKVFTATNQFSLFRKAAIGLSLFLTIAVSSPLVINSAFAANPATLSGSESLYLGDLRVIGTTKNSPEFESLMTVYQDLLNASNSHNIDGIIKHYSPSFISGDNLTLAELKSLIQETWQTYPNVHYKSSVKEVRISGDWATIETVDSSTAETTGKEAALNLPGSLTSESQNQLYFKKTAESWEVVGDFTSYEQAIVRYGVTKDFEITLSAPEQVKAGEKYSATFNFEVPKGSFSIGAITNEELKFPHQQSDDKFRPVNSSNKSIQRVLKANSSNRNEIVSATIGVTTIGQSSSSDRPTLGLDGIATIVKRVNVIPISKQEILKAMQDEKITRTSASGKVNLDRIDAEIKQSSWSQSMPQADDTNSSDDSN